MLTRCWRVAGMGQHPPCPPSAEPAPNRPPSSGCDGAQIICLSLFFPRFSPFFPFCSLSLAAISPATGAPRSGAGRGLAVSPPAVPSPLPGGDPWLCRRGPSPRQRWADRAIQQLVIPPVTDRPRVTRTDGGTSRAHVGGKSGAGSGPRGRGCGRGSGGGTGKDGEVGLRWPSQGSPACSGAGLGQI